MPQPNFLIIGAAKSGTSSVYQWLRTQEGVFMPDWQAPSYYVPDYGAKTWEEYMYQFRTCTNQRWIGESSVCYLTTRQSARWIKTSLGAIRLIAILRNPIERAFSMYGWMCREGYEWASTFEKALALEGGRFRNRKFWKDNPDYVWNYFYLRAGRYYRQLARYYQHFSREQVLVLSFTELKQKPQIFYKRIRNFLELKPQQEASFPDVNKARFPRSNKIQYLLKSCRTESKVSSRFAPILPQRLMQSWMEMNLQLGQKHELEPETRRRMKVYYRDDVRRLSDLLQHDYANEWKIE